MTRFRSIAILTVLLGLLVGCGGDDAPGGAAVGEAPVDGGVAVVALASEPRVLNPLIHTSAHEGQLIVLMNDVLMEMEEDYVYRPRVARSLTFAPDSLSVSVHLRPWSWSDGTPLTSADVAATFDALVDPRVGNPRAGGRISNVSAVEVVDDSTLVYRFHRRRADQTATLGHALLPATILQAGDPAEVRSWPMNQAPPSNGMFVLDEWERGSHLLLRRNDAYPGRRPHLGGLLIRPIPDETARLVELETGGVDFVSDVAPHQAARLAALDGVEVATTSGRLVGMVYWNHEREMFADRRVRKAMSLAVDRSVFIDGLLSGFGSPAAGPLPPVLWAYDPAVAADPFDPAAARRLLDEAGWRDLDGDGVRERSGEPLAFTMVTRKGDPVRENGIVVLRRQLAEVGVDVTVRVMEFSTVIDRVKNGDFDAYLGVFSARLSVDPSGLLGSDAFDRWNYGHYASATADSLMDLALSLDDRNAARPIWSAFQRHCAEDQPMMFLYYPDDIVAHSSRLKGVSPHVLSPFQSIRDWWIPAADRKYDLTDPS